MKRQNVMTVSIAAIFVVLMGIASLFDLQISNSIANFDAGWIKWFEVYGQAPGGLVSMFGAAIVLRLYGLKKTLKSIALFIPLVIVSVMATMMPIFDLMGAQAHVEINFGLAALYAIVAVIVLQVMLYRFPAKSLTGLKGPALVAFILLFIGPLLTTWLVKFPWGRWTYRDMIEINDLSLFTPWYLPGGNNGHHSFPSGHTGMAFLLLPLALMMPKGQTIRKVVWGLALLYGVLMAVSRVIIGAHFLSDVTVGAGITLAWFFALKSWFIKEAIEAPVTSRRPAPVAETGVGD